MTSSECLLDYISRTRRLENEFRKVMKENEQMKKKCNQLEKDLLIERAITEELQMERERSITLIKELRESAKELDKDLQTIKKGYNKSKKVINQLESNIENLQKAKMDISKKLDSVSEESAVKDQEIATLRHMHFALSIQ